MAYSLNRAQIIGNLTRDPEMRSTPNGAAVTSFSVATNFSWTDQKTGQRQDRAEYHNIVAWRRLAEIIAQYTKKGTKIFVEGRIETRDWTGEDGVKRYRTEIVADNIIILDSRGNPTGAGQSMNERQHQGVTQNNEAPMAEMPQEEVSIDDLPF